ncbi:MAG: YcxB family protein [Oscillospiraceae bacterium]|nr:YcxB family protein [Oscillospiraceae bacterium]
MSFESLPGIKINDPNTNLAFIIADFFSVYENEDEVPKIYKWQDFQSITESRNAFIFKSITEEFNIPKELIRDPAALIRVRAIIEGAITDNPGIEYKHGKRILPPKTLCTGCEIPSEAYVATGAYKESEINNSNITLHNPGFDKLIWIFAIFAAALVFTLQFLFWGNITDLSNLLMYTVISVFAGGVAGMSAYLFCAYGAKTLYSKILKDDPALLEEITFIICDKGFMAAETEVYDFSDIIRWHQVEYFIETKHVYIIFNRDKAVFWLPKRLFPKELHQELGDFIADRLLQK